MALQCIEQLTPVHLAQLQQLYAQEGWKQNFSLVDIEQTLAHSQLCLGLVNDKGELVAFCRVLSDFYCKAIIFDVLVRQDCRGLGLAKNLLERVKQHPRLSQVRQLELYCLPALTSFYAQFGFQQQQSGLQLMRLDTQVATSIDAAVPEEGNE